MTTSFVILSLLACLCGVQGFAPNENMVLPSILNQLRPGFRVTLPLSAFGYDVAKFSVQTCSNSPSHYISLHNMTVNRDISVNAGGELHFPITAPLTIDLVLQKKVFFWITIPCLLGKFGSCTYPDICAKLAESPTAHSDLAAAGLPAGCPFPIGQYAANNFVVRMNFDDAAPQIPSFLGNGDYKAKVSIKQNGATVACYDAAFTLEDVDRML